MIKLVDNKAFKHCRQRKKTHGDKNRLRRRV